MSVGRWRRLGPECLSPLWGIDAREGGPLETLVLSVPSPPPQVSAPGSLRVQPRAGGAGRQLWGHTAWPRIGLDSGLLLFLL